MVGPATSMVHSKLVLICERNYPRFISVQLKLKIKNQQLEVHKIRMKPTNQKYFPIWENPHFSRAKRDGQGTKPKSLER